VEIHGDEGFEHVKTTVILKVI